MYLFCMQMQTQVMADNGGCDLPDFVRREVAVFLRPRQAMQPHWHFDQGEEIFQKADAVSGTVL